MLGLIVSSYLKYIEFIQRNLVLLIIYTCEGCIYHTRFDTFLLCRSTKAVQNVSAEVTSRHCISHQSKPEKGKYQCMVCVGGCTGCNAGVGVQLKVCRLCLHMDASAEVISRHCMSHQNKAEEGKHQWVYVEVWVWRGGV